MKKVFFLVITFAFVMSFSTYLYAADLVKPIDKLMKGTVEVIKSPLVLVEHTKGEIDSADMKTFGLLKGLVESPFHIVKKASHGLFDIITFPLD